MLKNSYLIMNDNNCDNGRPIAVTSDNSEDAIKDYLKETKESFDHKVIVDEEERWSCGNHSGTIIEIESLIKETE